MDRLRVGVIGVGHLGRHHARILAGMDDVQLVGVVDTRPEQARAVADSLGTWALNDYRELLPLVDAVSVVVPTTYHRATATPFLERGVATLIEKPLAPSPEDAAALVDSARRHGAILQVGHIERFNPGYQTLVNSGIQPRYIDAERLGTYTFRSTDISVVFDLMIHDIDLVLNLVAAPVQSVSALGLSLFAGQEDLAQARIEFQNGTVVDLAASRANAQAVRSLRLWGLEGFASVDFATRKTTLLRPSESLKRGEPDWGSVDRSRPDSVRDHLFGTLLETENLQPDPVDQLTLELRDFVESIREHRDPHVRGEDGLAAVLVADQIQTALRNRRWDEAHATPQARNRPAVESQPSRVPAPKFLRTRHRRNSSRRSDSD